MFPNSFVKMEILDMVEVNELYHAMFKFSRNFSNFDILGVEFRDVLAQVFKILALAHNYSHKFIADSP